jgi:hypothetical protein
MMDGGIDTVEPDEGDFFEGVLLETCRCTRTARASTSWTAMPLNGRLVIREPKPQDER